ncbi:MAG TPA: TlpA disulfide reductase family protein, partial [Pyrinomonadaceae bacterium]
MMAASTQQHSLPQRLWTARRLSWAFITMVLLSVVVFSSCTQSGNVTTKNVASSNPSAVPFVALPPALLETQLTTLDGKSLKLSDYKGKIVVINLWASWCGPCRIETPELIRMSREYKERGVEFIGLTTRQNDPDIELVKNFVREQQVPYSIVYDDGSFAGPLAAAVRARAVIPQSYVLARD